MNSIIVKRKFSRKINQANDSNIQLVISFQDMKS